MEDGHAAHHRWLFVRAVDVDAGMDALLHNVDCVRLRGRVEQIFKAAVVIGVINVKEQVAILGHQLCVQIAHPAGASERTVQIKPLEREVVKLEVLGE